MKNVTYINAGAGSGKTYKLTEKLTELIIKGKVQPDQVILTTFTVKAANEFKEKAKAALFKEGMYNEAASLDRAMIGTVHSVCQRMIGKYWFNLGLSPDMGVMAKDDTAFYISQSLSELATDEELKKLHRFAFEFDVRVTENGKRKSATDYDFWQKDLKSVIDYATNYEIDDFKASAEASLDYIRQFMDPNNIRVYSSADLEALIDEHEASLNKTRPSGKKDERLRNIAEAREGLYDPTIKLLKQIAGTIGTSKDGPLADKFKIYMDNIWTSKMVFNKQEEYIKLLFGLAQRWKDNFAQYKREKNLLDYNDMEKYMRHLMNDKSVAAEISQSYRYLFVDEFQDSSPIQVKIFDALSDLMEHSYWVGDYKQAIYGFRGSDIDLTKTVVDRISKEEDGCDTDTLKTSWRSLPDIVEVNNSVFCETFKKVLDYDKIHLKQHRTNEDGEVSLRYFCCREGAGVAEHVLKLLNQGAKPNEIAVLALTNDTLKSLATDLNSLSVPCSREDASIVDSPVYQLVVALLRIVSSSRDALAKATVAFLTEKDRDVKSIIEDKILIDADPDRNTDEYLAEVPLVRNLLVLRPQLLHMSVASMVETVIISLDLYDQAKNIELPSTAAICLQTFIKTAKAYEQHCIQMNLPSTIEGFIAYVNELKPVGAGDPEGVQLYTYHSSKGLQWKYVIMMSLSTDIADLGKSVKRETFGVHVVNNEVPSADNPYPDVFIRLTPWVFGGTRIVPEVISDKVLHSKEFKAAYDAMIAEYNRLLYVGMTRAQDVMIMAIEPVKKDTKFLQWPISVGVNTVVKNIPPAGGWDIFGNGHKFADFTLTEAAVAKLEQYIIPDKTESMLLNVPEPAYASLPLRYLSPSRIEGTGKASHVKDFGLRIKFDGTASDMAAVGNCIHQIYAGIENGPASSLEMEELAASYGLAGLFKDMTEITKAWENLKEFLTETYGSPVNVYHERPFRLEKDGQTIVGSIDLVWETENGDILLDFKTCPLGMKAVMDPESEYYAGRYAGQLNAYEDALTAAGERVFKRLIYYPVSGNLVEVERL